LTITSACNNTPETSQESEEVKHFRKAQALFIEANRCLNKLIDRDSLVGSRGEDERNACIKMLTDTLADAKLVDDNVLTKIHPKLPQAYRSIFIPCIENQLRGLRDVDPRASIQGAVLNDKWIDWWSSHYKEFANI
jgi:hypothetical protein